MGGDQIAERVLAALSRPTELARPARPTPETRSRSLLEELGLTVLHAWQRVAESRGRGGGAVDVAVLFTDLVGFSEWALESGDELTIELLRQFGAAIEPPIRDRGGEVVKWLGDGAMAVFPDAPNAVDAAFEARERAAEIRVDSFRPELKTGIHLGRPRKIGADYFGVDVNIAARLLEAARPGEILISDPTLLTLATGAAAASRRPFSAMGVPKDLGAHVVERRADGVKIGGSIAP
jgi:class 3 adenylate cyclase